MMTRAWAVTRGYRKNAKVTEHTYRDGSIFYSLDNGFRTFNLDGWKEAESVIKQWSMEEVTDKFKAEGWIL